MGMAAIPVCGAIYLNESTEEEIFDDCNHCLYCGFGCSA